MSIKRLSCLLLTMGGFFLAGIGLHGAGTGLEFTGYVRDDKGLLLALKSMRPTGVLIDGSE
jgi:hypothetical protein